MHVLTLKPEDSKIQNCQIKPPKGVTIQMKAIQLSTSSLSCLCELKAVHFLAFSAAAAAIAAVVVVVVVVVVGVVVWFG